MKRTNLPAFTTDTATVLIGDPSRLLSYARLDRFIERECGPVKDSPHPSLGGAVAVHTGADGWIRSWIEEDEDDGGNRRLIVDLTPWCKPEDEPQPKLERKDRGELLGYCWNCGHTIHVRDENSREWLESRLCGACSDTPADETSEPDARG